MLLIVPSQKLREAAQKARYETENLNTLLSSNHVVVEALRKEVEIQKIERELLEKRVNEVTNRQLNFIIMILFCFLFEQPVHHTYIYVKVA